VLRALHDAGHQSATLCMIGPDKDGSRAAVETLAKELQVDHALEITGRLRKAERIAKSKDYNVFINTTNFDNTPVSVMEAMALGFPVVTTKVGGIPYLFEDGKEGVMVTPNSVKSMTGAIQLLLQQPERPNAIAIAARNKAEQWDWKVIRIKWEKMLESEI